jgi:hypothetical protein
MGGRFRENILDDALRELAGSLILFLYNLNTHSRFDVRPNDFYHLYDLLAYLSHSGAPARSLRAQEALLLFRESIHALYPPAGFAVYPCLLSSSNRVCR